MPVHVVPDGLISRFTLLEETLSIELGPVAQNAGRLPALLLRVGDRRQHGAGQFVLPYHHGGGHPVRVRRPDGREPGLEQSIILRRNQPGRPLCRVYFPQVGM